MANRAYLYSSSETAATSFRREFFASHEYYDSRHNFPFIWLFFFSKKDIYADQTQEGASTWTEYKLFAEKASAIASFRQRRSLLATLLNPKYDLSKDIDALLDHVASWTGDHLAVDPSEVIDGAEDESHRFLMDILEKIDNNSPDLASALRDPMCPCGISPEHQDQSEYIRDALGVTYSSDMDFDLPPRATELNLEDYTRLARHQPSVWQYLLLGALALVALVLMGNLIRIATSHWK